jgi:hypothetical protein
VRGRLSSERGILSNIRKGSCLHSGTLNNFFWGFVYQIFRYVLFLIDIWYYAPASGSACLLVVRYSRCETLSVCLVVDLVGIGLDHPNFEDWIMEWSSFEHLFGLRDRMRFRMSNN